MKLSRRFSIILAALLTWGTISPALAQTGAMAPYTEDPFRLRVRAFGTGTEVRLILVSGKKLRGTVGILEDSEFELITGRNARTWIPYLNLRHLEVRRIVFPDETSRRDAVRSVIRELGAGRFVKLKLVSGDKIKGVIQDPQEADFLLVPDRKRSELIPYDEVVDLQPADAPNPKAGMHPLKKIAIGYAIIMGLIFAGSRSPGGLP